MTDTTGPQQNGEGEPTTELASMVGEFENITDVTDWPGSIFEQRIRFDSYFGHTHIRYLNTHGYEVASITDHGTVAVVKSE